MSSKRYSDELPVDVEPYGSPLAYDRREKSDASANFFLLALYQVLLRVGWIFKTESIVMPMFMDFIGGGPVLRGCLMVLNRLGFSIPPVLFSRRLKVAPRKKWLFAACSFGMAVPFALLSLLWFSGVWRTAQGDAQPWMPAVFLLLYGLFFIFTGMNQLAAHALQGKVIRKTRRGRLFAISLLVGTPLALAAAWFCMPAWLAEPEWGYGFIFAAPAVLFAFAGGVALALREEPDDFQQQRSPAWHYFRHAWEVVRDDADCRALALLAVLFSMTFMLFPHYTAAVGVGSHFGVQTVAIWVCVQNASMALIGLVMGPLADRWGNRAALHLSVAGAALAPLLGIIITQMPADWLADYSWVLFVPLGFTPISLRFLANYALEIAPRHDHPKYISVLGLCLALPVIVGAPLVGLAVGWFGFRVVFALGFVVLLGAIAQTFRLVEPRHR